MPQRITDAQLAAIRQRAESATEGPWYYCDMNYKIMSSGFSNDSIADVTYANDEPFITNARQDIPLLLAEVERLKGKLEYIADITEMFYEVDPNKSGKKVVMRVRTDIDKYRKIIREILVTSDDEEAFE